MPARQLIDLKETVFPPFEYAHLLNAKKKTGDWRDELASEGFYVMKGAISLDRAEKYREAALTWQEKFGLGFKRDDVSTFKASMLPVGMKGGMMGSYGVSHEQWVWDVRTEPQVVGAFSTIWGTEDLVTSFGGIAIMLPHRTDVPDAGKWEHTDQSPWRRGFTCVQGVVNLHENGPDDGGLVVLRGSSQLLEEFFDTNGRNGFKTWGAPDYCEYTPDHIKWFEERGCQWEKVCADPGDLLLWDSRTLHYNIVPSGDRERVATYVCMGPAHLMTEADRKGRKESFKTYCGTSHLPVDCYFSLPFCPAFREDTGLPCVKDTGIPQNPVKATPEVLRYAGISDCPL